jgi:hydroxyacylglutathione hydrolase
VFTGGSLIVGSAARTDLLGAGRADQLARAQYRSLRRLAALPDATPVWPTHGAGSFCSAPPGAARVTTIGAEKEGNSLLAAPNEDAFAGQLLASLGTYPAYFGRLAEVNRRGPALLAGELSLAPLTPTALRAPIAGGEARGIAKPEDYEQFPQVDAVSAALCRHGAPVGRPRGPRVPR